MKKLILFICLIALLPLAAQKKPQAASQGIFNGGAVDTKLLIGAGSVIAVAAAILIYKSDNSH